MTTQETNEYTFFAALFDTLPNSILDAKNLGCKEEWFTMPEAKLVWKAIENIIAEGSDDDCSAWQICKEADRLAFKTKEFGLSSFKAYSFYEKGRDLLPTEPKGIEAFAAEMRNAWIARASEQIAKEGLLGLANSNDSTSFVTALTGRLSNFLAEERGDVGTGEEAIDRILAQIDKTHEEIVVKKNYDYTGSGYQTPWQVMNKRVGNFKVGLNIVAARPSVGKTSFAVQLMNYWCLLGHKVAFDCLDMAEDEVIYRHICNLGGVSKWRMDNAMQTPDEDARFRCASETVRGWLQDGRLMVRQKYDVDDFLAWCKMLKSGGKLDIVVIDYVQQLSVRGFDEGNDNIKLQEISKRLKSFALTHNVPVILLAQLNRNAVSGKDGPREPEISDIRGSGALEQDAYTITILDRDTHCREQLRSGPCDIGLRLTPGCLNGQCKDVSSERRTLDCIWVRRKKSQNGACGDFPMVVYNSSFQWYLGDVDAFSESRPKNLVKFSKLTADYRFNQEPFLSAAHADAVIYPNHWERIAERICANIGWEIPESLKAQIQRYNKAHTVQESLPVPKKEPRNWVDTDLDKED